MPLDVKKCYVGICKHQGAGQSAYMCSLFRSFIVSIDHWILLMMMIWYMYFMSLSTSVISLIVLGFNDTSTLVGHFVSFPREREKRGRRHSRRDEREEQWRKRNRNESEETEEIKTFPLCPCLLQGLGHCTCIYIN